MAPISIISSMATRQVLADLIAQFQQVSPQRVDLESAGGVDVAKRVQAGEAFDVVVLADAAIDKLVAAGRLAAAGRRELAKSGVGVAVRAGAAHPDIGSETALKHAVSAARSLSYSTGPSGVYLTKLFERWGIAQRIEARIVQAPPGVPVGTLVARGEVELGFQQLSELLDVSGIDILGPLPQEVQNITTFSAALAVDSAQSDAARALLDFMAAPAAAEIKRRRGMEPA